MAKIGFCAVSGSGMSALAQTLKHLGHDVYGSDRSFDQDKDQKNKQALTDIGIKIYPQDGSMLTPDFKALYASQQSKTPFPILCALKSWAFRLSGAPTCLPKYLLLIHTVLP